MSQPPLAGGIRKGKRRRRILLAFALFDLQRVVFLDKTRQLLAGLFKRQATLFLPWPFPASPMTPLFEYWLVHSTMFIGPEEKRSVHMYFEPNLLVRAISLFILSLRTLSGER